MPDTQPSGDADKPAYARTPVKDLLLVVVAGLGLGLITVIQAYQEETLATPKLWLGASSELHGETFLHIFDLRAWSGTAALARGFQIATAPFTALTVTPG